MKIKLVVLLLLLSSQFIYSQGFKGGIIVGFVASQVDGDAYAGYHKVGFQGGVYTRYKFNEKWSLYNELKFIQKGSSQTNKDDPYSDFKIKLNYIDLPFILNYQYNKKFIFGAGLSYGVLMSAEVQDGAGIVDQNHLPYLNYDANLIIQIKYVLNEHLWLDLKGAYSVIYITDVSPRQFNNLISFTLGYEF